jgi:hypothetical protein
VAAPAPSVATLTVIAVPGDGDRQGGVQPGDDVADGDRVAGGALRPGRVRDVVVRAGERRRQRRGGAERRDQRVVDGLRGDLPVDRVEDELDDVAARDWRRVDVAVGHAGSGGGGVSQ